MSEPKDWLNEPDLSPNDRMTIMAIEWLLPTFYFARLRPDMHFSPVGPIAMIHWIWGLYAGLSLWGVTASSKHRDRAVERRGLEVRACLNEDELEKRGLTPAQIVDELLAIEIERWEAHRSDILNAASDLQRKYYPDGVKAVNDPLRTTGLGG